VPIKPEGSRPPLFLVHAGGRNVISYRRFAGYLGADQPVWGLQSQGLRAERQLQSRIEDIAESYLEAIRSQQPMGPYFLGGHSFGALVALEMAQRLLAQGQQVPLLAILDHAGPDAEVGWADWIRWHLLCLSQLETRDRVRYLGDRVVYRIRSSPGVPHIFRRIAAGSLAKNDGSRKATIRLRQVQASLTAMENYKVRPYAGRMALFRAQQAAPRIHSDPWGGWRQTALGGLQVHEIPGHHMNMLEEPQVRVLAEKMRIALDLAPDSAVDDGRGDARDYPSGDALATRHSPPLPAR
jgi:thioesterase domain-containing protein